MTTYDKKTIQELVEGTIDFVKLKEMLTTFKDASRFDNYLQVMQEKVAWDDQILLPAGLHLYIVQKPNGDRNVKCDCGHEFGDYRHNWKLNALINVRDSEEKMEELYPKLLAPDPNWQVIREYYCPGCGVQLEVEAVTPFYPVVMDFEPDIDAFYEEWLGKPVPQPAGSK